MANSGEINARLKVTPDATQAKQAGETTGDAFSAGFSKSLMALNPGLKDLLNQMQGKTPGLGSFSAGGNKVTFPIETFTQKFGANLKQMKQGMSELKPALAEFERMMTKGLSGASFTGLSDKATPFDLLKMRGHTFGSFQNKFIQPGGLPFNVAQTMGQSHQALLSAKSIQNLTFGMMPLLNPTSLWGNMFASRQIFSAANSSQGLLGKVGLSGTGGAAAATGVVMGALLAIGFALKGLEKIVKETTKAYETARQQYGHALSSGGLALGVSIKRTALADIIGVSEKDVYMFGNAIKYLNPKLEFASSIMAKNAANLTSVSWGFKTLELDVMALFSTVANLAAPGIRKFTDGLSNMVVIMAGFIDRYGPILSKLAGGLVKGVAQSLFPTGSLIAKAISAVGTDSGAAPGIQAFAKQLPASHLERMGLVVGGFGIQDYAKQTAQNTRKMVSLLTMIAKHNGATTEVGPSFPQQ